MLPAPLFVNLFVEHQSPTPDRATLESADLLHEAMRSSQRPK